MNNYGEYKYTSLFFELPIELREEMNEKGNLFYSESYYNFMRENNTCIYYFFSEKLILVACMHTKAIFRWIDLPSEPFLLSTIDEKEYEEYINSFVEICRKLKIDWIGPTGATAFFEHVPQGARAIPFGSHVIDLNNDVDVLWSNIHSKHRNVIRNAEKKGVNIVKGGRELLDDYVKIDIDTWERSSRKSVIKEYCLKLLDKMPEYVQIYMAYYEGEPQGGAIFLQNNAMSYYMYGASKNNPLTGATNLLHWVAINDAKQKGIQKYSFVGCRINEDEDSKYHGIQRFKERFGGELVVGKMFKVIVNPMKYNMYAYIRKIRSRKEVKDVIDQEIHKWE